MEANPISEIAEAEEPSLGEIFDKYLPYWPWLILTVIIFLSGAWLYLRYKSPVYETKASLLIKDERKGASSFDPLEAFDLFGGKKSVENEMQVLQTKTLMKEVAENLHLYAPLMVTGRVRTSNAYNYSPIRVIAKEPDSVKMVQNIPFHYDEIKKIVVINESEYPVESWQKTKFGILKFIENPDYKPTEHGGDGDHYSFSLFSLKSATNSLLSGLTVTQSGKLSTVIDIIFKGQVPKLNEDILNELLKEYNKAAILDKNILAANTLKFIDDRLRFVEHDLDSVESSLQNFRSGNNLTNISEQGQIYLKTVAENDKEISDINMQLAILDQVNSYVANKGNMGGVVPATLGVSDPALTELLKKYGDLELQYEQMKKIVPENNPAFISIVDGIDQLKVSIRENISNQRKNLEAANRDLAKRSERYSSILTTIPKKERELLSISRQQSIKNNIYTFLLQKREETALSFASAVADSRIIDRPETDDVPVSPKRMFIYLISLFLAFILWVLIIYIKDLFTRTIQSRGDIEAHTTVPILGEVAFDKSKTAIVISEGKRTFIAEQFRQLRTALSYMGIDETHKRIMITSSISEEGKSFIAINLGISLSLSNKRVAVLELDLRKPKISEVFNISRTTGISTYLVGKCTLPEIMKKTGISNLTLLPSGPIPPNPSELISNGRFEKLLNELDPLFDFIIIDTAPTNPVTDAFLVSPFVDVSIYMVRQEYTPKSFLPNLEKFKKAGRLKNLCVVYNGVRGKGIGKYGYGRSYGNGYGYTQESPAGWKRIFKK